MIELASKTTAALLTLKGTHSAVYAWSVSEGGDGHGEKTARGIKRDRARVASGEDYEVNYESRKTRKSSAAVKETVKKVGNNLKKIGRALKRKRR